MKKFVFSILFLLSFIQVFNQKIFSVDYANQADIKVFVVKSENQTNLKVYKVTYENLAGENNGKWFFTKYANQLKAFFRNISQAEIF